MFGRATIALGIGPHSSFKLFQTCGKIDRYMDHAHMCNINPSHKIFTRVYVVDVTADYFGCKL